MKDSNYYILLIAVIVIFESIAQYHISESKRRNSILFFLLAIASYSVVCLLLHKCYDFGGMAMTNFTWYTLSIVSIVLIGFLGFDESITRYDLIGLVMTIGGLYLIFVKGH
uniref:EamA domain-containing protein n=1 Tax=viral metagenome TaxID=1070528 RepID=A0A6C0HGF8_9ZZZZ